MKRRLLKFEVVNELVGNWTVKTQCRGKFYTVAETFALPGRANAKEIADLIAEQLNEHEVRWSLKDSKHSFERGNRCTRCNTSM